MKGGTQLHAARTLGRTVLAIANRAQQLGFDVLFFVNHDMVARCFPSTNPHWRTAEQILAEAPPKSAARSLPASAVALRGGAGFLADEARRLNEQRDLSKKRPTAGGLKSPQNIQLPPINDHSWHCEIQSRGQVHLHAAMSSEGLDVDLR